jgi:hypothetical protein
MINLEELADQVLAIDNSNSREDVLLDLEYTKSVEETINRIFDSQVRFSSFFTVLAFSNSFSNLVSSRCSA